MPNNNSAAAIDKIDASIVSIAKDIRVLGPLSWQVHVQRLFLDRWHRGKPQLPSVSYPKTDHSDAIKDLEGLARQSPSDHPIGAFLSRSARSYAQICRLLDNAGTPGLSGLSREIYGQPSDLLSASELTNAAAARHFLSTADEYYQANHLREADYCLPADTLKAELEPRLAEVFGPGMVAVVIDPNMASKAAAGATRVRLRAATCFSEYDLEQLLQHEAFVHSLTSLNGRHQIHCQTLSCGAPRTTLTQEGLATFAELITGAIDIDRMERIALRVIAVEMALGGADFIEVFKFFLEAGQSEMESFNSAMRVFRGVPVTGGHAFTKDAVYLHGMMEVHTFFRWALQHGRLALCRYLFAGRMTINDVIQLEPLFDDGTLSAPRYLPPWMTRTNGLAGYLAFSVFANKINVTGISKGHRFDHPAAILT